MKIIIVITCVFWLTNAAPQNGYIYQPGNGQGSVGSVNSFTSQVAPVSSGFGFSSVGSVTNTLPLPQIPSGGPSVGLGGSAIPTQIFSPQLPNYAAATTASQTPQSGFQYNTQTQGFIQPQQQQQQPAIISKDIYIHSAPDEFEDISQTVPAYQSQRPVRKNYKIIFIKAPAHHVKHHAAALKAVQEATEEKTIIYVLTKKPDIQEIHDQLQTTQTTQKVNKPEVFFIKYKTQEEAQQAQQQIQAQYESLGGSTHVSDEGIAPVASVIGAVSSAGGQAGLQTGPTKFSFGQGSSTLGNVGGGSGVGGLLTGIEIPSRNYLPAKVKK